jgi:hypothetical protein
MNQIAFVAAAYTIAIGATVELIGWAWMSTRRAEPAVKNLRGRAD